MKVASSRRPWETRSRSLVAGDLGRHGEGLAEAEAALAVDEEGVVLGGEVVLERGLAAQQVLQAVLTLSQLAAQLVHRLTDLIHLLHQSAPITARHDSTSQSQPGTTLAANHSQAGL